MSIEQTPLAPHTFDATDRLLTALRNRAAAHEHIPHEKFNDPKLSDPTYLPTRAEIETSLGENDWYWYDYCNDDGNPQFEVFTQEYVAALGDYFANRAAELGHSQTRMMRILEVGAGNGRLSHFLNNYLNQNHPGLAIVIATDSGDYDWIKPTFPVERLNHKEALDAYEPDIVLCSWMTPNEDLSAVFRQAPSVQEYVLIGNPDICGLDWETWGYDPYADDQTNEPAPYTADGFTMQQADGIPQSLQLCRTDTLGSNQDSHSFTVSFRRNNQSVV